MYQKEDYDQLKSIAAKARDQLFPISPDSLLLLQYYENYAQIDHDNADFTPIDKIIKKTEKQGFLDMASYQCYLTGKDLHFRAIYDTALDYYDQAEKLAHSNHASGEHLKIIYTAKSASLGDVQKFEEAIQYSLKTLDIATSTGDSATLLKSYISISSHYADLLGRIKRDEKDSLFIQYDKQAETYLRKANHLASELNDTKSVAVTSFNLGLHLLGVVDDTATYYLEKALEYAEKIDADLLQITSLTYLSAYHIESKNFDQAEKLIDRAKTINQQVKCTKCGWRLDDNLTRLFMRKKQFGKAKASALNSLQEAKNLPPRFKERALSQLVEISESTGDYKSAYQYNVEMQSVRDSMNYMNLLGQVDKLTEEKERMAKDLEVLQLKEEKSKLEQQSAEQKFWLLLIISLSTIAALGIWTYNYRKGLKQKSTLHELEQKLLRLQMNPHFIFNALSSIQSLLLQKGKENQGVYYISKFSKLIRQILNQSRKKRISLKDEIETLENYLTIQKLRYDNSFEYEINIDKNLDLEDVFIPPMLVQPLIENAIEHGKIYQVDQGKVKVEFTSTPHLIKLTVKDNGLGLKNATPQQMTEHKSFGLKIIEERIQSLIRYNKEDLVTIRDNNPSGTIVSLKIPTHASYNH